MSVHPKMDEKMDKMTIESTFFRSIPVHFPAIFSYLCTGNLPNTSTYMAGTVKEMSLIKQVLQLKQRGESNRGIARQLPINKGTVNGYMQVLCAIAAYRGLYLRYSHVS